MDNLSSHFFVMFQVASPKQWTTWFYLLSCFKWLVLNNGQLEFTFCLGFKWLVLNNGQLEFTFLSFFKWLVLNNGQLEFTFLSFFEWLVPNNGKLVLTCHSLKCHPQHVWSRGVSTFQTNTWYTIIFPSETTLSPSRVGSFSQRIQVSHCSFSSQSKCLCRLAFIITSQAFIAS